MLGFYAISSEPISGIASTIQFVVYYVAIDICTETYITPPFSLHNVLTNSFMIDNNLLQTIHSDNYLEGLVSVDFKLGFIYQIYSYIISNCQSESNIGISLSRCFIASVSMMSETSINYGLILYDYIIVELFNDVLLNTISSHTQNIALGLYHDIKLYGVIYSIDFMDINIMGASNLLGTIFIEVPSPADISSYYINYICSIPIEGVVYV